MSDEKNEGTRVHAIDPEDIGAISVMSTEDEVDLSGNEFSTVRVVNAYTDEVIYENRINKDTMQGDTPDRLYGGPFGQVYNVMRRETNYDEAPKATGSETSDEKEQIKEDLKVHLSTNRPMVRCFMVDEDENLAYFWAILIAGPRTKEWLEIVLKMAGSGFHDFPDEDSALARGLRISPSSSYTSEEQGLLVLPPEVWDEEKQAKMRDLIGDDEWEIPGFTMLIGEYNHELSGFHVTSTVDMIATLTMTCIEDTHRNLEMVEVKSALGDMLAEIREANGDVVEA
jgi:hypothetical protein